MVKYVILCIEKYILIQERRNEMALINCPECGKQVSDQAQSCPECGYEIQGTLADQILKEEAKQGIKFVHFS